MLVFQKLRSSASNAVSTSGLISSGDKSTLFSTFPPLIRSGTSSGLVGDEVGRIDAVTSGSAVSVPMVGVVWLGLGITMASDGRDVGLFVIGAELGKNVGLADTGAREGRNVGLDDTGAREGRNVGLDDTGDFDGDCVGDLDGEIVGASVLGAGVGIIVVSTSCGTTSSGCSQTKSSVFKTHNFLL